MEQLTVVVAEARQTVLVVIGGLIELLDGVAYEARESLIVQKGDIIDQKTWSGRSKYL
jgi:hypothetical protein